MPRASPVFLLSPASSSGRRAQILMRPEAAFPLAVALREPGGAPLGDVFSFLSGLYFRGKIAYARAFASPADIHVITPSRGLMSPDTRITHADLAEFATVDISGHDPRYRDPLERDCQTLARVSRAGTPVVLLGSIASGKYVDVLGPFFEDVLMFPGEFVGRGDMSRGGLMLRAVLAGQPLELIPVAGAVRHGKRPAKLVPKKGVLKAFS